MTGSHASVSSKSASTAPDRVLVVGVNWIGDSVMSMPALQLYREQHPTSSITLLVKRGVADVWRLHDAPDRVMLLESGWRGTWRAVRELKAGRYDRAYILPRSFRSALIPRLAGIPVRIGMPGHWRGRMLTALITPRVTAERSHQAFEYLDLLVADYEGSSCPPPRLSIPDDLAASAVQRLAPVPQPRVGLLPGAARGPSKRWPAPHFAELGRRLLQEAACGVVILGGPDERGLCRDIQESIGSPAVSLAGETSLTEWAALLATCDLVVANDSGGMHIAAASGTPLVALYGMTDPARTGPLTDRARILQKSGIRSRDIARDSKEARDRLEAITPDEAFEAVQAMFAQHRPTA